MVTAGQAPQQSVPHLAMVHGAVYDAVNAIDGGHEGYLLTSRVGVAVRLEGRGGRDRGVPRAARTSSPAQQAALDAQYAASLGGDPGRLGEDARDRRRRGGGGGDDRRADGRRPLRRRTGSRSAPGPGVWRPVLPAFVNDPNAWLKDVKPFLIESGTQFRSDGPLALDEQEVRTRVRRGEVARIGRRARCGRPTRRTRRATGRRTRRTRGAGSSGRCPPSRGLSLVDNARLYAMLYMTAADALITVWNDKAHVPVLAADHRDPRGGHRRQPGDGEGRRPGCR